MVIIISISLNSKILLESKLTGNLKKKSLKPSRMASDGNKNTIGIAIVKNPV